MIGVARHFARAGRTAQAGRPTVDQAVAVTSALHVPIGTLSFVSTQT